MSDWVVEISRISALGQVDTRSVTLQDFDDPKVAKLAGIEECLKWAVEEGSPIPRTALDFWKVARRTMADYEASTELENRYGITATIKPALDAVPRRAEPAIPAIPPRTEQRQALVNGPLPKSVSLSDMIQAEFRRLVLRQKQLLLDRRHLDEEYEKNAADLSEIRSFLMLRGERTRKVRGKHGVRTRRANGAVAQQENQPDSGKDLS